MLFRREEAHAIEMLPGITRRVLAASHTMMLVEFEFDQHAEVPHHMHPHAQIGYIVTGRMQMAIGSQVVECRAGDSYFISPDIPHGGKALEKSVVVDIFNPPREDYV